MKNGVAAAEGKLELPDIPAGKNAELEVTTGHTVDANSEYFFRVRYDLTEATAWHPAGMPVAWDEIPLPWGKRQVVEKKASTTAASFTENDSSITIKADQVIAVIDRSKGVITSLRHKEQEWLLTPMHLNFWRPSTNNDEGAKLNFQLGIWQYAGVRATAEKVTVVQQGNDVIVTAELKIPAKESTATVSYHFSGAGQIEINTQFRPASGLPELPKVGFQCEIPSRTPVCKWYGRGPHENYTDRKTGAWTTIHELMVPMMFHRYSDPQESGNRTDVRWLLLTSPMGGSGLRIDATGNYLLETSIYPCPARDLTFAMHASELQFGDHYTLNVDHRQAGLGGTNSWGELALPQYRIQAGQPYDWSFMLDFSETPVPPKRAQPPMLPRNLPAKPPEK